MYASLVSHDKNAVTLYAVTEKEARAFLGGLSCGDLLNAMRFTGAAGQLMPVRDAKAKVTAWVLGLGDGTDAFAIAAASEKLPKGTYKFGALPQGLCGKNAVLAWLMGAYRFDRYKKRDKKSVKLVMPAGTHAADIAHIAKSLFRARDLINTPANDMGPAQLEAAARALAARHGAKVRVVRGADLYRGYPLIAAVGRGSKRAPRLIELTWGEGPAVTLVGKGVCFDTGGYNLKPSSGMLLMKKDMAGAACVLAVSDMVMGARLRLRLRVLIAAVENSISGNAIRPGDIFTSRKGLTVEIGNTDAEGRLILADALADADEDAPELLVDVATLTGAARSATGMELQPFFTEDERLAADLMRIGIAEQDPLWRLPLWRGYADTLTSQVADLNNIAAYNFAGAITAALFLDRFVSKARSWAHLDIAGWIDRAKPGRPIGGEASAARTLYAFLKERYGR